MSPQDDRQQIEALCQELGFSVVRFGQVGPTPHYDHYERWVEAGHHGDMDYLARQLPVRADPRERLPQARSVIVLAIAHHHERPPDPGGLTGRVARYAWGRDYHNLMGKRVRKLRKRLRADGIRSWGGVDTAPILERAWASATGLGYTGKNSVSILPGRTSWFFLGVVFVDVELPPDPPLARDHCGRCQRCLVGCPTDAFVGPRHLDARRCIAYWTIEAPGLPPRSLRPHFGRWVFGCDVCQEVCPHNHRPDPAEEDDLRPRHAWLDLPWLLGRSDAELLEDFRGTPLRRPKGPGLKRNALIVLGNLAVDAVVPHARAALAHPEPVVRAAAIWCLARHGARLPRTDPAPEVQAEIDAAADVPRL